MKVGDIVHFKCDPKDKKHYLVIKLSERVGIDLLCLETGLMEWDIYQSLPHYEVVV